MTRKECLDAAAGCVLKDRQNQYGKPEDCFGMISIMWSAYLGGVCISAHDVAAMMALLKIARFRHNPSYEDNAVDLAGYAACMVECATAQEEFDKALDEFQKKSMEHMFKKAEGCEELVQDEESDVERVFGTLKKRPAPEFDAPQTKEELIERIKSASPAIYGAHVE